MAFIHSCGDSLVKPPPSARGLQPSVTYAALDLGTNNCRMLIAKPSDDGFDVIEAFSRITRLGEGLSVTGILSHAAIGRTVKALCHCVSRLQHHRVGRFRAIATEACRRAENGQDFIGRVRREAGIEMTVIDAAEEAAFAVNGCRALLDPDIPDALVVDIGGGSTELIHVRREQPGGAPVILRTLSLPVGVVTLAEAGGLDPERYCERVDILSAMFEPFDVDGGLGALARAGRLQLLGTSGTVTTLAALSLDLGRYDRSRIDGMEMSFEDVERMTHWMVSLTHQERAHHPCIGASRADLVVAGCAILEAVCRRWPAGRLTVADRGVREGLLLSMMEADRRVSG